MGKGWGVTCGPGPLLLSEEIQTRAKGAPNQLGLLGELGVQKGTGTPGALLQGRCHQL